MENDEMSYSSSDSTFKEKPVEPKTFIKDGVEIRKDYAGRNLFGLFYFFGGLVGSFACFEFAYWVMSNFEVHYVAKSVVALIFSVLVIKSWDKATGEMPTLMSGPITFFTAIIFALSIFIGYNHDHGRSANSFEGLLWGANQISVVDNSSQSSENNGKKIEFGIIKHVGQNWTTTRKFKAGSLILVKIRGAAVKMANGDVLTPCDYSISTTDEEPLSFTAMKNITTTIEVNY
jgi:hypothetical protein